MAAAKAQWRCGLPLWWVVVAEVEDLPCFLFAPELSSHLGNLWWYALCFLHGRNNTAFAALVPGFCSSFSFDCISCLRTASVMLCFVLPPASAVVAGYSLAALCWKFVEQALAEVVTGLGFYCASECSCHFLGTACSDFVLLAFFGGHCLTCITSQTLCIILLWCLASPELDELWRLRCGGL